MDDKERQLLEEAIGLLHYPSSMDHYCEDPDCAVDNPKCPDMHMRAAVAKLEALADPEMKTLHPSRLTNSAERIYFEEWTKQNKRHVALNGGFTTLEHILDPTIETHRKAVDPVSFPYRPAPPKPSQRDAEVVTTLIQWLGTNCGRAFVDQCERRIKEESAERSDWWRDYPFASSNINDEDLAARTARRIVGDTMPEGDIPLYVRKRVEAAIAIHLRALIALYAIRCGCLSAEQATKWIGYEGGWHVDKTWSLAKRLEDECREVAKHR